MREDPTFRREGPNIHVDAALNITQVIINHHEKPSQVCMELQVVQEALLYYLFPMLNIILTVSRTIGQKRPSRACFVEKPLTLCKIEFITIMNNIVFLLNFISPLTAPYIGISFQFHLLHFHHPTAIKIYQ